MEIDRSRRCAFYASGSDFGQLQKTLCKEEMYERLMLTPHENALGRQLLSLRRVPLFESRL
jgi:hypothetical protein